MPTLQEIHNEIKITKRVPSQDYVRRKYLKNLNKYTNRATIIYASSFTVKDISGDILQLNRQDIQLFMSALKDVKGSSIDLILHSSGGSAEATEQIVNYLRSKFDDIRVIVPQNAMSAATMLSCAANVILMGKHSSLGPIDPQLSWKFPKGEYTVAAQSILDEFALAQQSVNNKQNNPILWVQKLNQYPPGLLIQCNNQIKLAKRLAIDWLEQYMFSGDPNANAKANKIGTWLSNNKNFLSHGRSIGYKLAYDNDLKVERLENDQKLQELVLSVFHATVATFQLTNCVKIVENYLGKGAYISAEIKKVKD